MTQDKCVAIIFSYKITKCDSRTMTYRFILAVLHTVFHYCGCVSVFLLAYLFICFHAIAQHMECWRDDQIKKWEEKWMNRHLLCVYHTIPYHTFRFEFFFFAVIIIAVELMVYVLLLSLLLCQRYSQRHCGCCRFRWWWWNEDFGFIYIRSFEGTIMMYFLCFLNGFSTMLLFDYDYG